MEPSREVLANAEFIVINSAEPDLRSFLGNYYDLKNQNDIFNTVSALYY